MAFVEKRGALATIGGHTVFRAADSGLAASNHQVTTARATRSVAVIGVAADATAPNLTMQLFSGDPGSGGTAIGEPFRPATEGEGITPVTDAGIIWAETVIGSALWIQTTGAGTINTQLHYTYLEA